MSLKLHNTLTRSLDLFEPGDPDRVGIYACGPTIYDHAHIGNFRSFLFYDLVHRYLEWKGYGVQFVMNLTDVDDKTIAAAGERGTSIEEFTAPFAESILADADALGMWRFDRYPRATDYVDRMIDLVGRLLDQGLAYTTDDGTVFFDISAFPEYGKLSRRDLDEGRTGERVTDDDYGKQDVRDFALWKGVKPQDEQVGAAWDAPWGRGRPGWHLECSAMGLAEVGETLDLHLGGEDLIFPHHEDEIAQSEGATGKPFARCWLHVKHLRVEGEKMSKSLGNFVTARELLEEGVSPAAIRHQLLSTQYRRELNFSREGLKASERAVERLLDFERRLEGLSSRSGAPAMGLGEVAEHALRTFEDAMDDDLNVAGGLAALFVLVNEANRLLDQEGSPSEEERASALEALHSIDRVLGLVDLGRRERGTDDELEAWVTERIEARQAAREGRDWARADAIRDELQAAGIVLEDGASGTRWKRVRNPGPRAG
ncbi:MAG: cysteine--tRNA ligase [Gemmatimonadota bacterium]